MDTVAETRVEAEPQQGQETLQQQRTRVLVQKLLQDAQQARLDGNLELALQKMLEAQDRDPTNKSVQQDLAALKRQMGMAPGQAITLHQHMENQRLIKQQQARAAVRNLIQQARQNTADGNYKIALQKYKNAQLQIHVLDDMDWGSLPDEVDALLADAKQQRALGERSRAVAAQQQVISRLREVEERQRARINAKVDGLLQSATAAFQHRRFKHAQDLADEALQQVPNHAFAKDIYNAATKSLRETRKDNYYEKKHQQYRRMMEEKEELAQVQTEILVVDHAQWEKAKNRGGRKLPTSAESAEDLAIRQKVQEATFSSHKFDADNGDYLEVIKLLSTVTGLPIIASPAARTIISDSGLVLEMNLVAPISLSNLLDEMVSRSEELAWTVRNGVVMLTDAAGASGSNVLVVHDIRNLVLPLTAFIAPSVGSLPTDATEESEIPRTGGESEEPIAYIEIDTLVTNIKDATDPAYWESEGVSMDQVESGYLLIVANPEMHRKVAKFLEDMDRFSTTVVTIESRFLTVTDNFLQEIGFDFRDTGGAGNKGTVAPLDDITNGNDDNASLGQGNSGTGDPAANPASGFFFDDGGDGDARLRTENFFRDSLGNILTPTGGLTAALTYLDDIQVNAIFRAVEKNENAQIVNSQTLTVLNNNHANMAVINQTSYIRDFDVEVAQSSFIADPKVDVIHDGVVLDVRPVISHDRKSITLVMEPTVAELQRPIPVFTTSLSGSTLPVAFQFPTLTVKTFSTTVQVPDGGSVLIGGLREVFSRERRAEIPLLASIPIISFFFKEEGVVDETASLMVVVKAQITDVVDEMDRRVR